MRFARQKGPEREKESIMSMEQQLEISVICFAPGRRRSETRREKRESDLVSGQERWWTET